MGSNSKLSLLSSDHSQGDMLGFDPFILDHDGELRLFPDAFAPTESAQLMNTLCNDVPWTQHQLKLFGKQLRAPRLSAWFGEPHCR